MTDHLGETTNQRLGLFVDTQNLYYAAREYYGGHIDYEELLKASTRGRQLRQATAYVVEREGEATAFAFVSKLSMLGYRVKRRTVRFHTATEQGIPASNGDWDMGIAVDIVRALDYLDVISIASGDGDFVPILELAQERGCRVEVIAFREAVSQELLDMSDHFLNLSEQHVFIKRERKLG